MEFDFDKITPCGGDCSGCKYFISSECKGCLATDGKCVHMWENGCLIYDCCKKNNVKFCGLCKEFPCKRFYKITEWDKDAFEKHKQAAELYRKRRKAMNVYKSCPKFENEEFLIRRIEKSDRDDLLKVYSDEKAVPFFNGDNCHGDDFHYTTPERMEAALDFWEQAYVDGGFVRFSIIDKSLEAAVGTVELFRRASSDYYNGLGVLRLDLGSNYETQRAILSILSVIIPPAFELFGCENIMTKGFPERAKTLEAYGFVKNENKLVGDDGTEYSGYYTIAEGAQNGKA